MIRRNVMSFLAIAVMALGLNISTAQAASETSEAPKGPLYVDFKNIVVPVIKKNGTTGVIALSMMAEVKDQKDQEKIITYIPKLKDAFIRSLYGNLEGKRLVREDGALDIERIKYRLMKSAQYVMKGQETSIQNILFQNISQQTY